MTKVPLLLSKILLLITICSILWSQLRWDEFADSFARTSTTTVIAVLALFVLQAVMAAMRWRLILRQLGYSLTVGSAVEAWLVGQCASQILPAVVGGDAARIIRLRRYSIPTTAAVVSVLIDRFAGFAALVVLSAFTVPLLATYQNALVPVEVFWLVGSSCLLVGVLLLSLRWTATVAAFRRIPWLVQVWTALRQIRLTKDALLNFTLVGLGTNLTVILSGFLLGHELNSAMSFYACLAILPLVNLLTFIPISVAGWGVREALMMSAFALIGVPAADALAVSIKLGLANLALGLLGGIVWIVLPVKEAGSEQASDMLIARPKLSA